MMSIQIFPIAIVVGLVALTNPPLALSVIIPSMGMASM